jgi:hypothetical protein
VMEIALRLTATALAQRPRRKVAAVLWSQAPCLLQVQSLCKVTRFYAYTRLNTVCFSLYDVPDHVQRSCGRVSLSTETDASCFLNIRFSHRTSHTAFY